MLQAALTRGSAMALHSLSKYKPQRSRSRPICSEYTHTLSKPAPCCKHRAEYIPQFKNTPAQCANVEQVQRRFYIMTMPNLEEIFYRFDFTDEVPPQLEEAQSEASRIEKQLVEKYSIPFEERNDLEVAHGNEILKTHCLGFTQGFKWAVYLLTGFKTDKEETADVR